VLGIFPVAVVAGGLTVVTGIPACGAGTVLGRPPVAPGTVWATGAVTAPVFCVPKAPGRLGDMVCVDEVGPNAVVGVAIVPNGDPGLGALPAPNPMGWPIPPKP
jgi:hypothetical protein